MSGFALALDTVDFDVLVDLSDSGLQNAKIADHLALFRRQSGLVIEGRRITLVLPRGGTADYPGFAAPLGSTSEIFAATLRLTGAARRGLLVVRGGWIPGDEAVLALIASRDADPMIGTIQPRFAVAEDDRIIGLPGPPGLPRVMLPRAVLPYLPKTVLSPELPAPLFLITPQAVLAADAVEYRNSDAALSVLLVGLRRRGFRNLICNHVVTTFPLGPALVYPLPLSITEKAAHP